jgi:hypothetical protein
MITLKMQNRIIYKIAFIISVLFFVVSIFTKTEASIISIKAPISVSSGQRITVDILVDPEDKNINSIESNIFFSKELLEFNGFSAKQSSIPIWVEEPKEVKNPPAGGGVIHFSGVIPGGIERLYDPVNKDNKSIPVVELFFISKKAGRAEFSIGDSQVLQNDGKGTATNVTSKSLSVAIIDNNNKETPNILLADTNPPKPFTINILERSVFGKTPRLATFITDDDSGGIEHYEVSVGNLEFQKVTSPFPLPYRLFSYSLIARAYDYSGNFREQQITVPGERAYGVGFSLLVLFIVLMIYRFYRSRRVKNI